MKSYAEIRATAWKAIREDGWVMRFLVVWMVVVALYGLVQYFWNDAVATMGIQTWSMFLNAKMKAMINGLDLAVSSRSSAVSMTEASAFEVFVTSIVSGICSFAATNVFLRAAKGSTERWFGSSFGGFRCPLGVGWLHFRFVLQIALWSLLFVLPGIMAYYRYCQAWNLKVEHPDWSAGRCLSESARMMNGHKAQRFALDVSYWRPITLLLLGLLALVSETVILPFVGPLGGILVSMLTLACMWGGVVLTVYLSIGRALFYLDLENRAIPSVPESGGRDVGGSAA